MARLISAVAVAAVALASPIVSLATGHNVSGVPVASLSSATAVPDAEVSVAASVPAAGVDAFAGVDLIVANTGTEPLTIQAVFVEGDAAGAFTVAGTFPSTVSPGATDTVRVALAAQVQGTYAANAVVQTDDPDEPAVSVPVQARRVERVYVNPAAAGGNGASWAGAYRDLSGALAFVDTLEGRSAVWVRGGTYRPAGSGRAATFVVREGVSLLGGFAGTEASTDRDPSLNPTVLTGDIGVSGNAADNAYNVVTVRAASPEATVPSAAPAVVDGVTVTGGSDTQQPLFGADGGGMTCTEASLVVRRTTFSSNYGVNGGGAAGFRCRIAMADVVFRDNRSAYGAAGLAVELGTAVVERATFERNRSDFGAGGAAFSSVAYALTGSRFAENEVTVSAVGVAGGGLRARGGSGRISGVTFERNRSAGAGGGAFVSALSDTSTVQISDVVFDRNESVGGSGGLLVEGSGRVRIERARFVANVSGIGGGLQMTGDGQALSRYEVVDSTFEDNVGTVEGGAIRLSSVTVRIVRGRFARNRAAAGGALSIFASSVYMADSEVVGNAAVSGTAGGYGGAFVTFGNTGMTVVNSLLVGNQAQRSGSILVALEGTSRFANVTVAANGPRAFSAQTGAQFPTAVAVVNAVAWPIQAPLYAAFNPGTPGGGGTFSVDHALVQGGAEGAAVVDADPRYMRSPSLGADGVWGTTDDDYGDLRVQGGSPAIDVGLASLLPLDLADLDGDGNTAEPVPTALGGDPRVRGTAVDLGAYESPGAVASEELQTARRGLYVAGPNPSRSRTTLAFYADTPAERAVVAVYDALGRQVVVLHEGSVGLRRLDLTFDTSRLAAGVYVVRASISTEVWSTQLTVMR